MIKYQLYQVFVPDWYLVNSHIGKVFRLGMYKKNASDGQQMGGSMKRCAEIQVHRYKMIIPCLDRPGRAEATHFVIVTWM